jgi:hypothetical protein
MIAVSITPTSLLAIPGIFYLMYLKQYTWKKFMYFIIPIITILTALVLWDFSKIIGIVDDAIFSPTIFFENFSIYLLIKKIIYELIKVYGKDFNLFSIFSIIGLVILFKNNRKQFTLVLCFILPFVLYIFNLGLISGDHLIISFFVMSYLGAYGLIYVLDKLPYIKLKRYLIVAFFISLHGWLSYEVFISPELRDEKELIEVIYKLSERFGDNAILMSEYNFGMPFWYLTQDEDDPFLRVGRPGQYLEKTMKENNEYKKLTRKFWINNPFIIELSSSVDVKTLLNPDNRFFYFVDREDWPSWIMSYLLPDIILEKRKRALPKISRLSRFFIEEFNLHISHKKIFSSKLYPVYKVMIEQ